MTSDKSRWAVVVGSVVFFLLSFPSDFQAITAGDNPALSLGLSLKTFMVVSAIVGLSLDRTLGYAMLLGATLQICLIRSGDFLAVAPAAQVSGWWTYHQQLIIPTLDICFRAGCLLFLWQRRRRLVGLGQTKPSRLDRDPKRTCS